MSVTLRERINAQPPEESVKWLNLLIYGEPGAGKTYLSATAQDSEETSPILFLDVEGGVVTIRKRRDVDVIQIRSMKKLESIFEELDKEGETLYYKTVIIDSISELQKLDMRTVMEKEYNRNPDKIDKDVATMRAWGISGERMRRIIRGFRDLPCNVIITALMAQEKDEQTNITEYFPSLPGKLRGEVPGFFDIVGLLQADAKKVSGQDIIERTLQTAKTRKVVAKDRTGALPGVLKNPSIPLMWEMITNGQEHGQNEGE